jgi:hypothetical protein
MVRTRDGCDDASGSPLSKLRNYLVLSIGKLIDAGSLGVEEVDDAALLLQRRDWKPYFASHI